MERQQEARNFIIFILLVTVNTHRVSSSDQNRYTSTTTTDVVSTDDDQVADRTWLQPVSTTISIYYDSTTNSPLSSTSETKEILDSSETIALNQYAESSDRHEENSRENDDREKIPIQAIPHSEHEEARDVPTRPKYVEPGIWAKPSPENIPLDFVPTKLHAQVRGTHVVKKVPQREAIKSAETDEERRNAPRLREVVTNTKVNTIYTEEGYEDSAYDHAGHVRDADFHEGFARKLHDRKINGDNSSSGNEGREEHGNVGDERLKEYEEDYQDRLEETKKIERTLGDKNHLTGYDKNFWEGTQLDPKLVTATGIQKLQEDIEKDTEETERNAKIYEKEQESKVRNDVDVDSAQSEESHDVDDVEHDKNDLAQKRKKKLQSEITDVVHEDTKEKFDRKHYETTPVLSGDDTSSVDTETPASPNGFIVNSPNLQEYSPDETVVHSFPPVLTASPTEGNESTTISYGQLLWDYFKAGQDSSPTESYNIVPNSTTIIPQADDETPIVLATIDGYGPYLFVAKEETTTLPSTFLGSHSIHPQNLFSDQIGFGPGVTEERLYLPGQSDDVGYVGSANNAIPTPTIATFPNEQHLLLQPLQPLNSDTSKYSSSEILFDDAESSTIPTVVALNITDEAYSQIDNYNENPFINPPLDNSNVVVNRNKNRYKVLVRPKSKTPSKLAIHATSGQEDSSLRNSQEEDENKKVRNELNAKYTKMLDYIKTKKNTQSPAEIQKLAFPYNFTKTRWPIPQRAAYSIVPTNYPPIVDHPSVSVESESPREINWRSILRDQHRSQPVNSPYRFDPFAVHSTRLTYHKHPLPATKLLPPSPLASIYANYYGGKQNDNYASYIAGKPQQRGNALKYFTLVPEANGRTRSRRKRSDKSEFRYGDRNNALGVKAAANNSVTNHGKLEQRDKSSSSRVAGRTKRKLSRWRVIDAPIDVPDMLMSASPERFMENERSAERISVGENSSIINRESRNAEARNEKVTKTIGNPRLTNRGPVLFHSVEPDEQVNDTHTEDFAEKRNIPQSETRSRGNWKNRGSGGYHEILLDESPMISGGVIDEEIAARFNNDNEPSAKDNGKIEIEVPSFDYIEEFAEDSFVESPTTEATINSNKYPFYNNKDVPNASALKYVVDPRTIPRKSSRGMEFYTSRDAYKQCDEIEPNLSKVLPEKEEPDPEQGPQEDLPRLRGLGDKLDCFKAKYFDENPLDSPLFAEKLVEDPTPPSELDPVKFVSKVLLLPEEDDEYVVQQVSKTPERNGRQWRNRNRQYDTHESIRVNYKHDPHTGRGRNAYMHTVRGSRPPNTVRRLKNRRSRVKISTTTETPKLYQTASYQNQVYEDVMGNIRNMANTYQVYEMTTLPSSTQILATAGSENALKISDIMQSSTKEKDAPLSDVTNVSGNIKSSQIKGLMPPRYSVPRQTSYRKHRPLDKNRLTLLRSNVPRIIAHHHTIKINKRSTEKETAKNSSESKKDENEKSTIKQMIEIDAVGNGTFRKSIDETTQSTNSTTEPLDLEIEESRQFAIHSESLSTTVQVGDKKKDGRGLVNTDQEAESSERVVYTIRDRIRYSKPRWDVNGFGKFNSSAKTVDEDDRRKEPRYNYSKRRKAIGDQRNDSISNSADSTFGIERTTSSMEDRESDTTEVYRPDKSMANRSTSDDRKKEYSEPEKAETIIDAKSAEHIEEEETEETTNTYDVRENVDEDVPTDITKLMSPLSSKEILSLQDYLQSDPPGYAEAFPEEATTSTNKYTNENPELGDHEDKQNEESGNSKNAASSWDDDDSSERAEEQVETPVRAESSAQEDSQEQTFFTYKKPSSSAENDKKDESSEKKTFYRPYPFSRYKPKRKQESDENKSEEESEEASDDYVFPWHADKVEKREKSPIVGNYEYPWERRERLAKERRKKRKQEKKFKKLFHDDEDEEETSKYERPVYPWERYHVPSKDHVNTRRAVSPESTYDSEESSTEQLPLMKFSSRYSSSGRPTARSSSSAQEISRSIEKFLENDSDSESQENSSEEIKDRSHSSARRSSSPRNPSISRGMLVPEDITQRPRRKDSKRRIHPVNKKVWNHSRFDSTELNSKEIDESEEKGKSEVNWNKSNLDGSGSRIQVESSHPQQLSNAMKEVSSSAGQRKKRRRKIVRNNSTISHDNVTAGSVTEPNKKRRRRPTYTSTPTSITFLPVTNVDLETSKSVLVPIRRIYPKADDAVKRNKSVSVRRTPITSAGTSRSNVEVESSTPKIRTIEHRSTVSKEKIVTKTTYPGDTGNFSSKRNVTSVRKNLKGSSDRKINSDNKRNGDNRILGDKRTLKQRNEKENYATKITNEKAEAKSEHPSKPKKPSRDFGTKNEEVKKINNFSAFDDIINDKSSNDDSDFGSVLPPEVYTVRNLLQNALPNGVRNVPTNERTMSEPHKINKDWMEQINAQKENAEEAKERRRPLSRAKFIKDPERRLYYYVERK